MTDRAPARPFPRRTRAAAFVSVLVVVACGSRTGLSIPQPLDAGVALDASHDAPSDAHHDASVDAPPEAASDAPFDAPPLVHGCSDGQREGFVDDAKYPNIAGCGGGFGIPGVLPFNPGTAPACPTLATHDTVTPACGRAAGDDGANPSGAGCAVSDLCEAGWHVCSSAADLATHSPTGCSGATVPGDPEMFFVTRQSSNGCGDCATGTRTDADCNSAGCTRGCANTASTSNDVFGCGNLGATSPLVDCAPIDRFSNNLCNDVGTNWSCVDDGSGLCEAYAIVHTGPAFGGALCCRD